MCRMMPDKESAGYRFLSSYKDDLIDYAFLTVTGSAVNNLVNNENTAKDEIDYDAVKKYLTGEETDLAVQMYSGWSLHMQPLFERCGDGESETRKAWLDGLVRQQAEEAVNRKNVTARKVKQQNGTGHQVRISSTRNRIISQVEREISLEVPAMGANHPRGGVPGEAVTDANHPRGGVS